MSLWFTGHATLTLKLYLTIFWGAWGLLAFRMRVISSFNSFESEKNTTVNKTPLLIQHTAYKNQQVQAQFYDVQFPADTSCTADAFTTMLAAKQAESGIWNSHLLPTIVFQWVFFNLLADANSYLRYVST